MGFLTGQLDYIRFLNGLGMLTFAAVALLPSRKSGHRLSRSTMSVFAFSCAMTAWLRVGPGDFLQMAVADAAVHLFSLAAAGALLWFGLLGFRWARKLGSVGYVGGWIAVAVALSTVASPDRYAHLAILWTGTVGTVLAVTALVRELRSNGFSAPMPVYLVGGAICLYSVTIFAQPRLHASWQMISEVTGAGLAICMALGSWRHGCTGPVHSTSESLRRLKCSTFKRTVLLLTAVVCAGWYFTEKAGRDCDAELRASLLARTITTASALNPQRIGGLTGTPDDTTKPDFETIRSLLKRIKAANPDCRFVYLMGLKGGRVTFLADAEPVGGNDYSAPGDIYWEATPTLRSAFSQRSAIVEGPLADRWGTWVTGLAPIADPTTGRICAVLGIDTDASRWASMVNAQRLVVIIIVALMCIISASVFLVIQTIQESASEVAASEQRYRLIAENASDVIWTTDLNLNYTYVSPSVERVRGTSAEEMIGRPVSDFLSDVCSEQVGEAFARELLRIDEPGCLIRCGVTMELEVKHKDGSLLICEARATPLIDSSGEVVGVLGVTRDITDRRRAEDALRTSEERLNLALEAANDGIWDWDLRTGKAYFSPRYYTMLGYEPGEFEPSFDSWKALVHPDDLQRAVDFLAEHVKERRPGYALPFRLRLKNGAYCHILSRGKVVEWDNEGNPVRMVGTHTDVTDLKKSEIESQTRMSAINAASDMVVITDREGRIEFVNPAFERETGYALDEVLGRNPRVLKSGKHPQEHYSELWKTIKDGKTWRGEMINRRKNGTVYTEEMTITPVVGEQGEIQRFIAIKRNVTEKKVYEAQLDHMAYHDALTDLPNRLLFSDRLNRVLAHATRQNESVGVMFLDIDHFKYVNDTLGHSIGDQLLTMVADRLGRSVRGADTIARMGGDEFTVIITDVKNPEDTSHTAKRVLEAFSKPFVIGDQELFVTSSVGISIFPSDGRDVETLVKNADTAMYRAKEQGRNRYQFYTEALNAAAVERISLEKGLRKALERDELLVHYQPRVDLKTGEFLGAEALVRWLRPGVGLIPPGQFITLAEETGLIIPMTEKVLRMACAQNKAWQDAGLKTIDMAVNVSARQFQQDDLVDVITEVLDEIGMDPTHLHLEITESTLMRNPGRALDTLRRLKEMGIGLSIDDFGTGYSSLSHLKRFPIDQLKIDRSFVKDIPGDLEDVAIAEAVIAMAHTMKLKVIAEGVETLDQLELLRSLGCDEMQGYFVSPPVPAADFEYLLRDTHTRRHAA